MPRNTRSAVLAKYRLSQRLSAESQMILNEILSQEEVRRAQRRERIAQVAQRKPSER